MKVLILGHKGNLGSRLMDVYSDLNPAGWDREELDITNEQAAAEAIGRAKPDLVFNCVAYNAVDAAETERETAELLNGYAVGFLAKACQSVGAIFVHYSSGMVFDGENPEGYGEDDLPSPANAYGKSKLLGEMEAQSNADRLYLIRTSWLFGPPAAGAQAKPSFVDVMLAKARAQEKIMAVEDEIGKPTYTVDLAQASRALVEEGKPFGIYHLTNSGTASRLDWTREIFAGASIETEVAAIKGDSLVRAARRPHFEVLNNTKFLELRPWTEALRDYLKNA